MRSNAVIRKVEWEQGNGDGPLVASLPVVSRSKGLSRQN